jgi:3-methyl-2-oxobutanoate hydroxymethyltransferase
VSTLRKSDSPPAAGSRRKLGLDDFRAMKRDAAKFTMLTAYDHPTAALAEAAGVHALLIGDSLGCVLLGHENTRGVPLDLMITLGQAVRRGAPNTFLIGDLPFESLSGSVEQVVRAARRFVEECGCDAVKIETASDDGDRVRAVVAAGIICIAHLGLRPQTVSSAAGYRVQARDGAGERELVRDAQRMAEAGAAMLLLEAIPPSAAQAVVDAVDLPIVGCGAGPACDGHVVVTQDMLGMSATPPPRFVPVLANVNATIAAAMSQFVRDVSTRAYPAHRHTYSARAAQPEAASEAPAP